jgi:hypothetical protein
VVTRFLSSSSEGGAQTEATSVILNLSVPYESIYNGAAVNSVIIPGKEGEYGITVNHVPYVAQMKPGVLQVLFEGAEPEKYFVAGGYAFTHANSVTVREFCNQSKAMRILKMSVFGFDVLHDGFTLGVLSLSLFSLQIWHRTFCA